MKEQSCTNTQNDYNAPDRKDSNESQKTTIERTEHIKGSRKGLIEQREKEKKDDIQRGMELKELEILKQVHKKQQEKYDELAQKFQDQGISNNKLLYEKQAIDAELKFSKDTIKELKENKQIIEENLRINVQELNKLKIDYVIKDNKIDTLQEANDKFKEKIASLECDLEKQKIEALQIEDPNDDQFNNVNYCKLLISVVGLGIVLYIIYYLYSYNFDTDTGPISDYPDNHLGNDTMNPLNNDTIGTLDIENDTIGQYYHIDHI